MAEADDDDEVELLVEGTDDDDEAAVGDSREKHVTVVTLDGERIEHGDVYVAHAATSISVSSSSDFPDGETVRYEKADLRRIEITQHHAACFITTAVAGDGPTLAVLRGFRDEALARSAVGRLLLWSYELVSPPIARTLERHPSSRTTRTVRRHVERCATLARRRDASGSRWRRRGYTTSLTLAYVAGVALAAMGWVALRLGERLDGVR